MTTVPEVKTELVSCIHEEQTNCTDLTILTPDKTLYYTKYIFARESEYFNKKFNGKLGDANENIVDMKEYDTKTIKWLLNILDADKHINGDAVAEEQYNLLKLLNYYQFGSVLKKVLISINNSSMYYMLKFMILISADEFINGVYGKEFRESIKEQVKIFVKASVRIVNTAEEMNNRFDENLNEFMYMEIKEALIKLVMDAKIRGYY